VAAAPKEQPVRQPDEQQQVSCPICLSRLTWSDLPLYRFDTDLARYVELTIPADASPEQRARALRTASVRCPNPGEQVQIHFLPAAYGQYGRPAVFGFVGAGRSGKTHLLAAMVGEIERYGLRDYGASVRPIDQSQHQGFLDGSVRPLLGQSQVLETTRHGVVSFVDALLVTEDGKTPRPVALFDVSGEELVNVEDAKSFLDIADGLIFVVDPGQLDGDGLGDSTFNTVLNLLEATDRLSQVSAAVVLNKGDILRFDDPVARWLRREPAGLDAAELLAESADIYAYLTRRGAQAWTRPYRECGKATLHVASATGGPRAEAEDERRYPRGVTPRRVLGPLVALLAMTGVLTSPEAQKVGI
jgi:hypothetical protein